MHIIIPMSGTGNRFVEKGYKTPKPLIEVDGKPIIEHVCDLFPNENNFTFICNSEHLKHTKMRKILLDIKPSANIIEIEPHKLGPVYAVLKAFATIDDDEEVIVNYCDFGTYWNYNQFLFHTRKRNADGAIAAYKGFHPHMLGDTNYAFMREENQWMLEIQEKKPFTENRLNEYASNGTYYFKKGIFVKKYFSKLIDINHDLNGEYYVSLIYNLMKKDNLNISIYEIQHMLQWGTPEDLEHYNFWSEYFRHIILKKNYSSIHVDTINLIPLAGEGSRFLQENYSSPKPLLDVNGYPMICQAASSLPLSQKNIFVALKDHNIRYDLKSKIKNYFKNCEVIEIDKTTSGQAITCSIGLKNIDDSLPLNIGACDNSMIFDSEKYSKEISDHSVDALIFTFKNHISSNKNPHMYGWVETEKDIAKKVSVKKAISSTPKNDHVIVGAFYFRKISFFNRALDHLINEDIKVNNEFYVDSVLQVMIDMGYKVKVLEVEKYIGWGTPDDYETFLYWQSYFHKSSFHPYNIDLDRNINIEKREELRKSFYEIKSND